MVSGGKAQGSGEVVRALAHRYRVREGRTIPMTRVHMRVGGHTRETYAEARDMLPVERLCTSQVSPTWHTTTSSALSSNGVGRIAASGSSSLNKPRAFFDMWRGKQSFACDARCTDPDAN